MESFRSQRSIEIDLARSLAIVMMIIYHLAFDLSYFYGLDIDLQARGWYVFQRFTALLFLMLVGVSYVLSRKNTTQTHICTYKRALKIFCCAMLITLSTYLFVDPERYIRFGVLHCIAISLMLLPLFENLREWNVFLGALIAQATRLVTLPTLPTNLLLPIGITRPDFASLDYFPLLPWFGIVLMGMGVGHFLYRRVGVEFSNVPIALTILSLPGRKSLLLYMIHQPVIIGILSLIFGNAPWEM